MGTTPADIVNRALDDLGRPDLVIGDIEEGTEAANPALRAYMPALEQLLRAAHWTCARKMAPLVLLADATGNTAGIPNNTVPPWLYEYEVPQDAIAVRFVPQNNLSPTVTPAGNISLPATPLFGTAAAQPYTYGGTQLIPSPFLMTVDSNFPVDPASNWADTRWASPAGRTVILSNVQNAQAVYTFSSVYPQNWDSLFEQCMVEFLKLRLARSLARDAKLGEAIRAESTRSLMAALTQARLASANEAAYPQTTDNIPDFMRVRDLNNSAGPLGPWSGADVSGSGYLYLGWQGLSLGNGSVF